MFFRKARKEAAAAPQTADAVTGGREADTGDDARSAASAPLPPARARTHVVPHARLTWRMDPAALPAEGQAATASREHPSLRAPLDVIDAALDARRSDRRHLFLVTPPGFDVGASLAARLTDRAARMPTPADIVLVPSRSPEATGIPLLDHYAALELPAGSGAAVIEAIALAHDDIAAGLSALLSGEPFWARRLGFEAAARADRETRLAHLERRASDEAIALLRTATGYVLAPMHDGRIVKPDVFGKLPPGMQEGVRERIGSLEAELVSILEAPEGSALTLVRQIAELARSVARPVIDAGFSEVRARFAASTELVAVIDNLCASAERRAAAFATAPYEDTATAASSLAATRRAPRRLWPRLFGLRLAGEGDGAPVRSLAASAGGPVALFGGFGTLPPSRTRRGVKAGAMHEADGGFLVLAASDIARDADTARALDRALAEGWAPLGLGPHRADGMGRVPLSPAVPARVTLIMHGTPEDLAGLMEPAPTLADRIYVASEVADHAPRTPASEAACAAWIDAEAAALGDVEVSPAAMAGFMDGAARRAGLRSGLTSDTRFLSGIIRAAAASAAASGRRAMNSDDVARAIAATAAPMRARGDEPRADAPAGAIGVARALVALGRTASTAALATGASSTRPDGVPSIHATIAAGTGRADAIVRALGPDADWENRAAAAVLWGMLATEVGDRTPLPFAASLTCDGLLPPSLGRPHAAEAVALLSALADVPVDPGLAIAGEIDAAGNWVVTGSIVDSIDAWAGTCLAGDATRPGGIIVPAGALDRIMLDDDTLEAVAAGRFEIHACASLRLAAELAIAPLSADAATLWAALAAAARKRAAPVKAGAAP
ncbi:MAG: AAA family ATPase [Hyphomicrobiaceae bacterium]|nr:AAA family ATPase [Hyphomicrobiaceae bacterium]